MSKVRGMLGPLKEGSVLGVNFAPGEPRLKNDMRGVLGQTKSPRPFRARGSLSQIGRNHLPAHHTFGVSRLSDVAAHTLRSLVGLVSVVGRASTRFVVEHVSCGMPLSLATDQRMFT